VEGNQLESPQDDKLISADLADGDKFNLSSGDATGSDAKNKCSC